MIFSFDAETNGLWGRPFAVGALVLDDGGGELARFVGRCPIEGAVNDWVAANVLPAMAGIPETHPTYDALLADFAAFYLLYRQRNASIIAHMAVPVEAGLLRDMHDRGFIGDFDGPYPLIDVAGLLLAAGADPTSVDAYAAAHGIGVCAAAYSGGTHNPLFDAALAAAVFRALYAASAAYRGTIQ